MEAAPETFSVDVSGETADRSLMLLWPYMAHPSDQDRREQMTAWLWAQVADLDDPSHAFSGPLLKRLTEAAQRGVGEDLSNATAGGCMAGDVLNTLLKMTAMRTGELAAIAPTDLVEKVEGRVVKGGLDVAQYAVSRMYRAHRNGLGDSYRANRETVRQHWRAYRNVSHLWAAHLILLRACEREDRPLAVDGIQLAAVATALRKLAVVSRLPTNEPVLDENALQIVGAPTYWLTPQELTVWELDAIASFEPRKR